MITLVLLVFIGAIIFVGTVAVPIIGALLTAGCGVFYAIFHAFGRALLFLIPAIITFILIGMAIIFII